MTKLTIKGIQEAQDKNLRRFAAMKPDGAFGQLIHTTLTVLHRFMTGITHVITGALRASVRLEMEGLRGHIFIDPSSVNPIGGERPVDYGPVENARGGDHAFFDRTVQQAPQAVSQGVRAFLNSFE